MAEHEVKIDGIDFCEPTIRAAIVDFVNALKKTTFVEEVRLVLEPGGAIIVHCYRMKDKPN